MQRDYTFSIGQNVKMYDHEDQAWVKGIVTDKTSVSVFIKWEDLSDACEHNQSEYGDIKLEHNQEL